MRHLSTYKLFEGYDKRPPVPKEWIHLHSIGYVMNPYTGDSYPLIKGNFYEEDSVFNPEDGEDFHSMDEEDIKIVDTYYRSSEEFVKNRINFNIIETLKDLSMDYIDDGMRLMITIFSDKLPVYIDYLESGKEYKSYAKFFPRNMERVRSGELLYTFEVVYWKHNFDGNPSPYRSLSYGTNKELSDELLKSIKGIAKDSGWKEDIILKSDFKRYHDNKINESSLNEIVVTLEDICDDLRDEGYSVEISMRGNNYEKSPIGIEVNKREEVFPGVSIDSDYTLIPFSYMKIKPTFDRIISYMESEGYTLDDLVYYRQKMGGGSWVSFSGKHDAKHKSFRIKFK